MHGTATFYLTVKKTAKRRYANVKRMNLSLPRRGVVVTVPLLFTFTGHYRSFDGYHSSGRSFEHLIRLEVEESKGIGQRNGDGNVTSLCQERFIHFI